MWGGSRFCVWSFHTAYHGMLPVYSERCLNLAAECPRFP